MGVKAFKSSSEFFSILHRRTYCVKNFVSNVTEFFVTLRGVSRTVQFSEEVVDVWKIVRSSSSNGWSMISDGSGSFTVTGRLNSVPSETTDIRITSVQYTRSSCWTSTAKCRRSNEIIWKWENRFEYLTLSAFATFCNGYWQFSLNAQSLKFYSHKTRNQKGKN